MRYAYQEKLPSVGWAIQAMFTTRADAEFFCRARPNAHRRVVDMNTGLTLLEVDPGGARVFERL